MISIVAIPCLKDNYIWAIIHATHRTCVIVDPGDADPVKDYLRQHHLTLVGILITHHHWDHTNGLVSLLEAFHVPVVASHQSHLQDLTQKVGDEVFKINTFFPSFKGMLIPGHTLDHIAYHMQDALFCGDTLFGGGCGRVFEGTEQQLYTSLHKLTQLPDSTQIFCGHEYTLNNLRFARLVEPNNQIITQRIQSVQSMRDKGIPSLPSLLSEEKATNPFLRCDSHEIIHHAQAYAKHKLQNPIDVFCALRQWKNTF